MGLYDSFRIPQYMLEILQEKEQYLKYKIPFL
jgi:hypothetical protein